MEKKININSMPDFSNIDGNRLKIITSDIQNIITDEIILDIIKKIKSAFPFTFIEKSNIQKLVNKLEGFFWIKETGGKYILTNDKFAKSMGVRVAQIENKLESDIVPANLRNVFNVMNTYIIESANSVVLEPILNPLLSNLSMEDQIIQFPLLDVDNKAVAIVGVSLKKSGAILEIPETDNMLDSVLPYIKELLLILSPDGRILNFTGGLINLLKIDDSYRGKKLEELFDSKFLLKYNEFLKKIDEEQDIPLTIESDNQQIKTSLKLKKIFDDSDNIKSVHISFPPNLNQSQTEIKSAMYDLIMQISPDAIFIYDIDNLKFLEVNDAAVKMYGYKRNELLNMDLTDLYAPEDIQTLIESSDSKNPAGTFTGPWRHKKKDGSSILVEISKASLEYKGKRAHLNIVRDITEKVEDSRKVQFYQASFEGSSDLIVYTDNDGFITFVNEQVTKVLGYSKKDLEKRPFLSLAVDEDRAKVNKEIFHSGLKNPVSIEIGLKNHSNDQIHTEVFAKPVLNFKGEIDSFILVIKTEVSGQKAVIAETVKEQTIDASFLSNVFHEILTPINVIVGFTQELYESITSPNNEQKEAAAIISENQKILLQTMDNAVEYTSLEQKALHPKPEQIHFTEILDEVKNNIKKNAEDKGIEFAYGKISSSLVFESDKQRFISLLTLLIKFSIQLTKEKTIYLSAYNFEKDSFAISIKDQRSSISPSLLKGMQEIITSDEKIIRKNFGFSRFSIRLVQKLMEMLFGRVEVIKKSGQPVEYAIVFPNEFESTELESIETDESKIPVQPITQHVKEETITEQIIEQVTKTPEPIKVKKEEAPKIEKKQEIEFSKLSCIYLEDQVDSQILFKSQMKDLKKIDVAPSFEKALPLIKNNNYDFIVMDINLQGEYNGLDALRIIQKMPDYEKVPIIACTAYVLPGAKENFIAAGFKDFISKPVMRDKLAESLKRIYS